MAENVFVSLETLECKITFALKKVFSLTGAIFFKMANFIEGNKTEAIFTIVTGPYMMEAEVMIVKPLRVIVTYHGILKNIDDSLVMEF